MKHNDHAFWLSLIVMILLIVVLVVLYFVLDIDRPAFYQPGSTWIASPSDWGKPPSDVHYQPVADVRPRLMPAYKIELSKTQMASMLKPTSDGGCLAIAQIEEDEQAGATTAAIRFQATRFQPDGAVRWTRQYDDLIVNGYLVALCVFPDGHFALSARTSGIKPEDPVSHDQLMVFSSSGHLLWQSAKDSLAAGSLDYLLAATDGAILAAGTVQSNASDAIYVDNDISLMRFESDGRQTSSMLVGRNGEDYLASVAYAPETGLVLLWQQTTRQTSVGQDIAYGQTSNICAYSDSLQEQWVTILPEGTMLERLQVEAGGPEILAFGRAPADGSDGGSTDGRDLLSTLFCLDRAGKIRWTHQTAEPRTWIDAAARLPNGTWLTGRLTSPVDQGEKSILMLLDANGQALQEIDQTHGYIQQLALTRDGGWTVIFRQTVDSVPQPPYISSIWMDSEAIVAHYDQDNQLVWRRTINQYRGVMQPDQIVVTTRDTLLVG